jgi:hypothetical protein
MIRINCRRVADLCSRRGFLQGKISDNLPGNKNKSISSPFSHLVSLNERQMNLLSFGLNPTDLP